MRLTAAIACACPLVASPLCAGAPEMDLNPTNRTVEILVPVTMDGFKLGETSIQITPDDRVLADTGMLKTYLAAALRPEIVSAALVMPPPPAGETLAAKKAPGASTSPLVHLVGTQPPKPEPEPGSMGAAPPSYLPLDIIRERGVEIEYDPLKLELNVKPSADQRPTATLSLAPETQVASAVLEQPAAVSAYINLRMVAGYVSQADFGSTGVESPSFDFDGAIRLGRVVLETEGTFSTGDVKGFSETYFDEYAFYRRGARLVYDLPEDAVRIRVGDVTPDFSGFQTAPDLLGVSAEKSYAQLQPGKSIRPTGQRSFRLERPSTVDILIDGATVRRLRLSPGTYNVADLPLRPGANAITLNIEEDAGARQTLEFTAFSAQQLLAPGVSEWSLAAGIKSFDRGLRAEGEGRAAYGEPDYEFDAPVATAFYRVGAGPALTAELNAQADDEIAMAGGGVLTQMRAGLFSLDVAASLNYGETPGVALQGGYASDELNVFGGYASSVRLLAEYQSPGFVSVGQKDPSRDYSTVVSASLSQRLPFDMSAGLSASYYLSRDDEFADRWSADFTLSKQLWAGVSGSLAVGYGQDEAEDKDNCCDFDEDGFRTFMRLSWTPDSRSSVLLSHDSRSEASRVSYTRSSERSGAGAWNATVEAARERENDSNIYGALAYSGNRADVSVSHSARVEGMSLDGAFEPRSTEQRTSLRVASSLVYADGAVGLGRPVSGGFAIVSPHESLGGASVLVGSPDAVVAESGWFGPAVAPSVSPYAQTRLPYDAPGMPVGYDLGRATYDFMAPYKAGFRLTAGSAYTVTAMGTLLSADGEPIPLLAGTAREANKQDGPAVELFTNRAGRFGAQGLAPGRWIVEMPTGAEPTRFAIDVPEGTAGLHDSGALRPISS
jgi:outer membrane usher protein